MKSVLLFAFFSLSAFAETYLIEGTAVKFRKKNGLLVSRCGKTCEAVKVVEKHKNIELKNVRKDLKYAGAIGSDVCHEVYKASSLLGRDVKTKDQRAFCYFSDKSMVEINSLTDYLEKKKYVH